MRYNSKADFFTKECLNLKRKPKGPFKEAIFVKATRCKFCRIKIALGFKHVGNPCDIAATNRTWFTPVILKLQL